MGDYTTFHFVGHFHRAADPHVIKLVDEQINQSNEKGWWRREITQDPKALPAESLEPLPDHPFFETPRYYSILSGEATFDPRRSRKIELTCEIKWGWEEVPAFLGWLAPHLRLSKRRHFLGWSHLDVPDAHRYYWHWQDGHLWKTPDNGPSVCVSGQQPTSYAL